MNQKTKRKHSPSSGSKTDSKSTSKSRSSSSSKDKGKENVNGEEGRAPNMTGLLRHHSSSSSSAKSDRSQLIDLVVEDTVAEETERVRARKEGSAGWNKIAPKRYVRTYGEDTGEDIRSGYEPTDKPGVVDPKTPETTKDNNLPPISRTQSDQFSVGEDDESSPPAEDSEESRHWKEERGHEVMLKPKYGLEGEDFENVWSGAAPSESPKENP